MLSLFPGLLKERMMDACRNELPNLAHLEEEIKVNEVKEEICIKDDVEKEIEKHCLPEPEKVCTEDIDENTTTTTTTRKATNWIFKINADSQSLHKIRQNLQMTDLFTAVNGKIEIYRQADQTPMLQSMLKTRKQTTVKSIFKIIMKIVSPYAKTFSIYPVTQAQNIETFLKKIEENSPDSETYPFSNGKFKYSRFRRDEKLDPGKMIEEHGISKARMLWARNKQPFKVFEKAVIQFQWQQSVEMSEINQKEAKKALNNFKKWQMYIHDIFLQEPDTRTIYVVLDREGGKGKTFLQNVLKDLYPDEILDIKNGRTKDITYQAKQARQYKMVQVNITRQMSGKVNQEVWELLKDGNFSSSKYNSSAVRMKSPHVFIYTNRDLKWTDMSLDRWKIIHLHDKYEEGFKTFTYSQWINLEKETSR